MSTFNDNQMKDNPMKDNSIPFTPVSRKRRTRSANYTFNRKNAHHDLYDILTYNIPNFYDYLKENMCEKLKQNEKDIYINIRQKGYSYNGKYTNSDKGEYFIEFVNFNEKISKVFYKKYLNDVHFTLHKYSNRSNKLHFTYVESINSTKTKNFNLELKYNNEENQIEEKEMENLKYQSKLIYNSKYSYILETSRIIIQIINDYIKDVIEKKKNNCYQSKKRGIYPNKPIPFGLNLNKEESSLFKNPNTNTAPQNAGYKNLKKVMLIELCKEHKISGYSKLNKSDLIKLLKKNKKI